MGSFFSKKTLLAKHIYVEGCECADCTYMDPREIERQKSQQWSQEYWRKQEREEKWQRDTKRQIAKHQHRTREKRNRQNGRTPGDLRNLYPSDGAFHAANNYAAHH